MIELSPFYGGIVCGLFIGFAMGILIASIIVLRNNNQVE